MEAPDEEAPGQKTLYHIRQSDDRNAHGSHIVLVSGLESFPVRMPRRIAESVLQVVENWSPRADLHQPLSVFEVLNQLTVGDAGGMVSRSCS